MNDAGSEDGESDDERSNDDDGGDDETTGTGARTVTVAADVDDEDNEEIQREFQEERAAIQEALEEGEIDEEEAQIRMQEAEMEAQEAQLELLAGAVEALEEHVTDTEGLAIAESDAEMGLLLVEGEAEPIVELLTVTETGALLPEDQFEAFR